MAITYEVKQQTTDTGSFQREAAEDSLRIDLEIGYDVTVTDPADQNFDPRTIGVLDAMMAPGLPVVNETVYFNNGLVIPYLVCRRLRGSRTDPNRGRFEIQTTWNAGNSNQGYPSFSVPPASLAGYPPKIEVQLGQDSIVRYDDKDAKQCLTPTGRMYSEPFIELVPTEIRTVTQYESFISFADMRNRKFKTNSAVYDGRPIGSWFITQVEAIEVRPPLDGGPNPPAKAAQVTYTIAFTERPGLWKTERALIDTHYKETGTDEITPFVDDKYGTMTTGQTDVQGYPHLAGQDMEYDTWRMQDEIDFDTFLLG